MKKVLLNLAFVAIVAALASCKKENSNAKLASCINNDASNSEIVCTENDESLRYDIYTQAYLQSVDIITDLTCSKEYDIDDLYDLGDFNGIGYVFCVPSSNYPNTYLIVFPSSSISTAFVVHPIQDFTNSNLYSLSPLKDYEYEIYDACNSYILLNGKIYPNSGDLLFTVSNVYISNFANYAYNLTSIFNTVNVGSYSYYGQVQGTTRLSLDEFLSGIALSCYYNF